MRNTWLVIRHEVVTTLTKRSFWLMTFLFPLAIVGMNLFTQLASRNLGTESTSLLENPAAAALPIGYVDEAGLIHAIPADLPDGLLRGFPNTQAADAALQSGELDTYVVVPADFAERGSVVVVKKDASLFSSEAPSGLIEYVVAANLLDSEALARAVRTTEGSSRYIAHYVQLAHPPLEGDAPAPADGSSRVDDTLLPYAVMFILFFVLTSSGGYVLQSVSAEKENRTVEVLLVSLRPRDLMLGKVLGLGVISLLQMAVWLAVGGLVLGSGRAILGLVASIQLPAGFAVYALLYGLFGYLAYSSALAAIGALAPGLREGAQFQILVIAPLIIPLMLNYPLLQEPNGALAVALSLVPLTAPMAMMMRVAAVHVPFWQIGLSLAGLAVTAVFLVNLAGKFFRADTLLTTAPLSMRRLIGELRRPRSGQ